MVCGNCCPVTQFELISYKCWRVYSTFPYHSCIPCTTDNLQRILTTWYSSTSSSVSSALHGLAVFVSVVLWCDGITMRSHSWWFNSLLCDVLLGHAYIYFLLLKSSYQMICAWPHWWSLFSTCSTGLYFFWRVVLIWNTRCGANTLLASSVSLLQILTSTNGWRSRLSWTYHFEISACRQQAT